MTLELELELPRSLKRSAGAFAAETRRELGLPDDRPIVATGHQAELWHPGILVKYMAAAILAERHGGAAVHLIVDQDVNEYGTLALPIRTSEGRLGLHRHRFTTETGDLPTGEARSFTPEELPREVLPATADVGRGARAILDELRASADAPSAALQIARALDRLMQPYSSGFHIIAASQLLETFIGRRLLESMAADPWRCAEAYNRAAAAFPESATPLSILDDRVELPLWRLEPDGRRLKAWDDDIERARAGTIRLRPRALLLTALMRSAVCDLFIHGVGGRGYDRAMEQWMDEWLGMPLEPMGWATATLHLPLGDEGEPIDVNVAQRELRRFWHDPDAADSGRSLSEGKAALLRPIANLPRGSRERRAAYRNLHDELSRARASHEASLKVRRATLETALLQASERPIRDRRTWAFPLYPHEMLVRLRNAAAEQIDRAS